MKRLAQNARGHDPYAYRDEFLQLVAQAQSLSSNEPKQAQAISLEGH